MPITQHRPDRRTGFAYFLYHKRRPAGGRLMRCLAVAAMFACVCGLIACGHGKSKPIAHKSPAVQVLDYRNGWFHTASGRETIADMARAYDRDAGFVAQLNQMQVTTTPAVGTHIYIPPTNNVAYVRERLLRMNGDVSQVPKIPWNHKLETPDRKEVVERKVASEGLKTKVSSKPVLDKDPMIADAAPASKFPAAPRTPSAGKASSNPPSRPARTGAVEKPRQPVFQKNESFHWPVSGDIVTRFQERRCRGIEIAAAEQSPVMAARSGIVLLAQDCPAYGNLVLIDHGDGYASVYGYNSTLNVKENDWVKSGQQIASVGRPSRGAPSKLFFQIRRNAKPVDPLEFLN